MRKEWLFVLTFWINATFSRAPHSFFLISIPKAGTHLAARCLELMTYQKIFYVHDLPSLELFNHLLATHRFACSHLPYDSSYELFLINNNIKVFFIIRDPRDEVVSFAHWVYQYFKNVMTFDELLTYLIKNGENIYETFSPFTQRPVGLADYYQKFLPWRFSENVCILRFEDLVGLRGGGSDLIQCEEIKRMAEHIGITLAERDIDFIQKNLFGGTFTFKEGLIGSWRHYFSPEHNHYFSTDSSLVQLLRDLNYRLHNFNTSAFLFPFPSFFYSASMSLVVSEEKNAFNNEILL